MPRYRHKQQLKRYILQYGEPDPLTRHLILHGERVTEPLKALEPYVEQWEEHIQWMQEHGICLEEYDYDLFVRSDLETVVVLANEAQLARYKSRIEKADKTFCDLTVAESPPFQKEEGQEWWMVRIPKEM